MNPMKARTREEQSTVGRIDEFDLTAAIWILSSLDENPVMTYRGVVDRVGSTEENVRRLVFRRRELFRPGVREFILDSWKSDMRKGITNSELDPRAARSITNNRCPDVRRCVQKPISCGRQGEEERFGNH